jgi:hypothetical protein
MWVGVGFLRVDPMVFLTQVTAPFIFGTIIVLNVLEGSLFGGVAQPLKGLLNSTAAAVIGVGLALLYSALAPVVTGALPSGRRATRIAELVQVAQQRSPVFDIVSSGVRVAVERQDH